MGLLIGSVLILLATLGVYWPAAHAGFIWDDDDILTANPLISAPGGVWLIWAGGTFYDYWPMTLTSFWLEWRLWALNAAGYHVTNILLHVGAAIFLWRGLRQLGIRAAWLSGLVFAIHPTNVQSVAWITERKNTLSLFFAGMALVMYLRSEKLRRESEAANSAGRRLRPKPGNDRSCAPGSDGLWYWLSFAVFVLALLSKTSVVLLPVVLLLCVWWLARADGHSLTRVDVARTMPFFGIALGLALVTIWFQYQRSIGTDVVPTGDFRSRLARAGMAVWFYLARIVFPRHPMFVYPRWTFSPDDVASYVPGVLLVGVWGLCWRYRNRWGKPLFFALTCFLAMLFPVMGFFKIYFQKYSFVADHWAYPAMIAIIALIVGGGAWLVRSAGGRWATPIGLLAAAGWVGALAPLTWAQCGIYQNEETLWRATLTRNSQCWLAHHNLASLLVTQCQKELSASAGAAGFSRLPPAHADKLSEALFHEQATIALKPDHAAAEYGAGHILSLLNRPEEAVPHFRRAIELQPDMVSALDSLAWILATHEKAAVRDGAEAVRLARSAVALTDERNARLLETLAVASAGTGDYPAAIQTVQKALRLAAAANDRNLAAELATQLQLFQSQRAARTP